MMFCPKCGSLLKAKQENDKLIDFCSCGYENISLVNNSKTVISEKIFSKESVIPVSEISPFANESHVCSKCGFNKAIFVDSQIAVRETAGCCEFDRPAYICGKCGFKEFI